MVKILHLNTLFAQGGAALLMQILAQNLGQNHGFEQYFVVKENIGKTAENIFNISTETSIFGYRKLTRIISDQGFLYRFFPIESGFILKTAEKISPDIIHLHNIHGGFFQTNLVPKLSKIAPVVWTFHDMFPITGHCAYSFECEKWKTGCGNCERLDIYPSIKKDRTKFLWKYKNKIFNSADFTIVTPSNWLKKCVEESFLKNKDIRLIYNGIDLESFTKTDKSAARKNSDCQKTKKSSFFRQTAESKIRSKAGNLSFKHSKS